MEQHKISKYLNKLSNENIQSEKFGLYLTKLNYWYQQYGGTYGDDLQKEATNLTDFIIKTTSDKKTSDSGLATWAKQGNIPSIVNAQYSNNLQRPCVANGVRDYTCEDKIKSQIKQFEKKQDNIISTIENNIKDTKDINKLENSCTSIDETNFKKAKISCCNKCGKKYVDLKKDKEYTKKYTNSKEQDEYWDIDKQLGNICGCKTVHMA